MVNTTNSNPVIVPAASFSSASFMINVTSALFLLFSKQRHGAEFAGGYLSSP
jgi:hypothetical protein